MANVPTILLVDDQRDILRLLHSTLDTLGHKFQIFEAPSGEEALLEASRHKIDLLVSDYKLPGITGVELMHKIRARHKDVKVVLVTAVTDKRTRDDIRNAGAAAIFDKPIPLGDFLDVVERSLGLERTILPPEASETRHATLSDLLAKFRKAIKAQAVYLLSDRGRVLERAGDLYDSSMEVSLLSAVMAIFSAGQKVSKFIHQDGPDHYHVFRGGDHDLLLIPVNSLYGLLVAGEKLTTRDHLLKVVEAALAARADIERALRSLGVPTAAAEPSEVEKTVEISAAVNVPTADIENLLTQAKKKKIKPQDADAFWSEAVEKHGNPPLNPDEISYEQAKKLGLAPGDTRPVRKKP
ncbi:MAG: response regulator [Chloroflexota bacterium]